MSPISVHVLREYHGLPAPQDIRVPTASELAALCTGIHPRHYNLGLAYPSEAPVFWIKYGPSIIWNEVPAQVMAYEELRRLSSPVKAPGIFYACDLELRGAQRERRKSYIPMQYIPGKTADEWLKNIEDLARADSIYSHIAFALFPNSTASLSRLGLAQLRSMEERFDIPFSMTRRLHATTRMLNN